MDTKILVESIGWLGAIEVVIAYGMNSAGQLKSDAPMFQWLNLTGAIFLIINTAYNHSYPSMVINIIWTGIAIVALVNMARKKTT